MEFLIKRDVLLKTLNLAQGIIEKKNTWMYINSFIIIFMLILVFYITIRFANKENVEVILGELLSFILVLTGVSIWEKTKK